MFEVTDHDRAFYAERLRDFLPPEVIDIHAHSWLEEFRVDAGPTVQRAVTWTALVATDDPLPDLAETYRLLFPEQRCRALVFGFPDREFDVDRSNDYVAAHAVDHGFDILMLSRPEWPADEFAARLDAGRFLGAKVYLNFAPEYLPGGELRILDFAPHHHLEVLAERGAILMLHIPRSARLRDAVNIHEMKLIEARYPQLQIIIAHVGRAYCAEDLGDAFDQLASAKRLRYDISANTNADVFAAALRAVGPGRMLFGSDLPITRMRMRRICEGGRYVNLVPPGLYGDVSGDPNMRECDPAEADRLTFFLYEEIDAFRRAAEQVGIDADGVRAVFHDNAAHVIAAAARHYGTPDQPTGQGRGL